MKHIVILDGHTLNPGDLSWQKILDLGQVDIYPRSTKEEVSARIKDAEIIVVNKVNIDADIMDNAPNCRCICVTATGYNNINIEKAKEKGIIVLNACNYGTLSVAQHVFALLLEITNQINTHYKSVKAGDWGQQPDFCFWKSPLERLEGKTMGIVGFGAIGQAVANIAHAFGMNVKVWTRNKQKVNDPRFEAISFEEIITSSDIISLHIPSTGETINKMNQAVFQKMKENVILINTSRGDLINEEDLYEGLKMKKPAFAALDVLKVEPPVEKSPLFELDNCIITPHIAWASKQAREKLMDMTVDNIVGYIEGKPLNNLAAVK